MSAIVKIKQYAQRFWKFVWYDDSWLSWVVNLVLAFIIIKFLFYPALGFALATDHPVVAVMSESMQHTSHPLCLAQTSAGWGQRCVGDMATTYEICGHQVDAARRFRLDEFWKICGPWYEQRNITLDQWRGFGFSSGFNKGDVMVLYGTPVEKLEVGHVIVFTSRSGRPIIHRIVGIDIVDGQRVFMTKGDRNSDMIRSQELDEMNISQDAYIGRAVIRLPLIGWVKILFTDLLMGIVQLVR